jgi:hypothetical protein
VLLVGLSGRGDKDVSQAQALLGIGSAETQAQQLVAPSA